MICLALYLNDEKNKSKRTTPQIEQKYVIVTNLGVLKTWDPVCNDWPDFVVVKVEIDVVIVDRWLLKQFRFCCNRILKVVIQSLRQLKVTLDQRNCVQKVFFLFSSLLCTINFYRYLHA